MNRALLTGRLLVLATAITLAIILLGNMASTIAVGREPFGGDPRVMPGRDAFLKQGLVTGLPLLVLALCAERRRAMWVIAATIMAGFWIFFVWQLRQDYLTGFAGGANIGLGLIMVASPFVALLALAVAGFVLRRQPR